MKIHGTRNICNDYGAARVPHPTKQAMKMHGHYCIFNDSGAARVPHPTKQAMKMYGNPQIFNGFWGRPRSFPTPPNKQC